MDYRTEIRETVVFLDKEWPEWKKEITSDINVIKDKDDTIRASVNKIIGQIRALLKQEQLKDTKKEVNDLLNDKKVTDVLYRIADSSIRSYRSVRPLRNMEDESIEITKGFISMLFERAIVRVELGITEHYAQYKEFGSEEEMLQVIQALSMLTEFYVRKHWSRGTIIDDFCEETGFCAEICEYYADLIDKYYNDIRMNIMIDALEQMEDER